MATAPRNWAEAERRLERLEAKLDELSSMVRQNEKKLVALPYMRESIKDVKADCKAVREWVEEQIDRQREITIERDRLTGQQKVAIIGAVGAVLAAIVGALALLQASGAL